MIKTEKIPDGRLWAEEIAQYISYRVEQSGVHSEHYRHRRAADAGDYYRESYHHAKHERHAEALRIVLVKRAVRADLFNFLFHIVIPLNLLSLWVAFSCRRLYLCIF